MIRLNKTFHSNTIRGVYMNLTKIFVFITAGTLFCSSLVNASQVAGIDIYGYFQSELLYERSIMKAFGAIDTTTRTTSEVAELDLFFNKQITQKISALVNFQLTGNYSSENLWGDFNLDQAWVKFDLSKMFVLRIGHLVPIFNQFNEIKSRFPLFPFIVRPAIYESNYGKMVQSSIFLPLHAAMQINGTVPMGKTKFDYAIFGGNSEFINTKKGASDYSIVPFGTDSTNFKMVGGRLGLRAFDLKFGVSGTYDKSRNDDINGSITMANNTMKEILGDQAPVLPFIGEVPRYRFGVDLSFTNGRFNFQSEYIYVHFTPDGIAKRNLDLVSLATQQSPSPINTELDRQFAFASLTCYITEKFNATIAGYYNKTVSQLLLDHGLYGVDFCLGYNITDGIAVKAQIRDVRSDRHCTIRWNDFISAAAISVFF